MVEPAGHHRGLDCRECAKRARDTMLAQVASGEAQLAVGTHALFQEQVNFSRLGLAVVDEQHRFGVEQRLALHNKA